MVPIATRLHITEKELRHLYWELGWSQKRITEYYGCSVKVIQLRMKHYGIPTRHVSDYTRIEIPCAELRALYVDEGLSTPQIAAQKGCGHTTIWNKLRECGISLREAGPLPMEYVPAELLAAWPTPDLAYAVGQFAADGNLKKGATV